jgi:hypothetical protein
MKKVSLIFASLFLTASLTSCTSEGAPTRLLAHVVLLDISGSSSNSIGSFSSEDHSPSSLSERQRQLEEKIRNAISQKTAVYFGFVRKSYGQTEIATLVPASLILEIESVLKEDILNEKLLDEAEKGISKAWGVAIDQERNKSNSCSTDDVVRTISSTSGGNVNAESAGQLARKLCSGARNSIYQFSQLQGTSDNNIGPKNIGSDIQGAVDRSLQKLASDELRLVNAEGKSVALIPTVFLVSDLIQISGGQSKPAEVFRLANPSDACSLAKSDSETFNPTFMGNVSLVSDGFAGSIKEVDSSNRDKLMEYWKCWFETRNITDIDIGAKGIDLGGL